jgi:hypothetical protein
VDHFGFVHSFLVVAALGPDSGIIQANLLNMYASKWQMVRYSLNFGQSNRLHQSTFARIASFGVVPFLALALSTRGEAQTPVPEGSAPHLFDTVKPDVNIVIKRHPVGADLVDIKVLDPHYSPELLTKQCELLCAAVNQSPQYGFVRKRLATRLPERYLWGSGSERLQFAFSAATLREGVCQLAEALSHSRHQRDFRGYEVCS